MSDLPQISEAFLVNTDMSCYPPFDHSIILLIPLYNLPVFHSNDLLQLNTTPPKPEYYVNYLILKEIREIDYIVSKASKL